MAIALVNSSTNSGTTSPLTINAPADCQVGDVLIAWILARGVSSSITDPGDWTLIGSPSKVGSLTFKAYWHVWATGETSYSWTVAGGYYSGGIIAWRGVNQITPINAYNYGSGTSSTTVTVTEVTATALDCMADFRMGGYSTSPRTFSAESLATWGSMAEQYDMGNNRCGNAGAYKAGGTGATGNATATISGTATEWAGALIVLKPDHQDYDESVSLSGTADVGEGSGEISLFPTLDAPATGALTGAGIIATDLSLNLPATAASPGRGDGGFSRVN